MSNKIKNITDARNFLFGGKSTFTIVSGKTDKRYTFKVNQLKGRDKNNPFFVSFLNGGDESYQFIGTIFDKKNYRHSKKSKVSKDSVVGKTANWIVNILNNQNVKMFDQIEFWHEGKCCRCGRKLTTPESISSGVGPVCSTKK